MSIPPLSEAAPASDRAATMTIGTLEGLASHGGLLKFSRRRKSSTPTCRVGPSSTPVASSSSFVVSCGSRIQPRARVGFA
jgi:hypothetical protein